MMYDEIAKVVFVHIETKMDQMGRWKITVGQVQYCTQQNAFTSKKITKLVICFDEY